MIVAGIATIKGREDSLGQTVASLMPQVDRIVISRGDEVGDAAKFEGAAHCNPSDVFLSCDDDLTYPPDYVQHIVAGLKKYGGVVSFHGRIMAENFKSYYRDSYGFPCLGEVDADVRCDTLGTGVMAMKGSTAHHVRNAIRQEKHKNMADIHVSRYAHELGLPMTCLAHKGEWITHNDIDLNETIWAWSHQADHEQTRIMREVLCK